MAGYRPRGGQNRPNKNREPNGGNGAARQSAGNRPQRQPAQERTDRSGGARTAAGREPRGEREFAPGEFFTLGEHTEGRRHYRFRYNGKLYRIMEGLAVPKPSVEGPDVSDVSVGTDAAIGAPEMTAPASETESLPAVAQAEPEETVRLEETDAKKAYEAWNRIKRPERYGL